MQHGLFDQLIQEEIQTLIEKGAIVVCNHSGGKDSQAMYHHLNEIVPKDQLIVVHATLGNVEWPGTVEHIQNTIQKDHHFEIISAKTELLEMVKNRGKWPSPQFRYCTSSLKTSPIEIYIRRVMKKHGFTHVINCLGLRAEESHNRAKKNPWELNERGSKAGRTWYTWLPIFNYTTAEVFQTIRDAGQRPHWAYLEGMTRLSCRFCIMASREDLTTAARLNPELYQRYVQIERDLNFTFQMPQKGIARFLPEITGVNEIQQH